MYQIALVTKNYVDAVYEPVINVSSIEEVQVKLAEMNDPSYTAWVNGHLYAAVELITV